MSAIILSQDHATGMYLDQNCRFIVYSILAKFLPHITNIIIYICNQNDDVRRSEGQKW